MKNLFAYIRKKLYFYNVIKRQFEKTNVRRNVKHSKGMRWKT